MGSLADQVLALLASDAGSLLYHLVLAFSIAGTLQISLNQSQRFRSTQIRRVLLGVGALLVLQLALFVASGLVWQAVMNGRLWLPLLDRTVSLLSLALIVWLWSFPNAAPDSAPASGAPALAPFDSASLFIGLLALAGCAIGSAWWLRQGFDLAVNGSTIDLAFQVACLCVAGIGLLNLALLRPAQWGYGVAMLGLLAAGSLAHLFWLPYGQDYPSLTRLFEIAAFPFLLLLPGRAAVQTGLDFGGRPAESKPVAAPGDQADQRVVGQLTEDSLWKALFSLVGETAPEQAAPRAAAILARAAQAELALLALPPGEDGKIEIIGVYDGRNKRFLPALKMDAASMPVFSSSMKLCRVRRLAGDSTAPDIATILKIYDFEQVGNILLTPVLQSVGVSLAGVALAASDAQKDWSPQEQADLSLLAKLLVHFLQRIQAIASLRNELDQVRQSSRAAQEQAQQVQEDSHRLRNQLAVLQEAARRDQEQIMDMAALVSDRTILQAAIAETQAENRRLQAALEQTIAQADARTLAREKPLEGELRLALEEIAILRAALADAENEIGGLEARPLEASASSEQLSAIQSIGQDLRQPLSSIVGYTDLLLGESAGILGAAQRKYLERIKLSTERTNRLIDDLAQASMAESNPSHIERAELDLCAVVQEAIKEVNRMILMKRLTLKPHLPTQPLKIISDPQALRRVVAQLLHNAASVTPEGGEMGLTLRLERSENKQDFVLVQVNDHGGGIAPQDIPKVFAPYTQETEIQGLSKEKVDFLRLKTLIEILGGRAWVDTEPGIGAAFSILLPVAPEQADSLERPLAA